MALYEVVCYIQTPNNVTFGYDKMKRKSPPLSLQEAKQLSSRVDSHYRSQYRSFMPKAKAAWASWIYSSGKSTGNQLSVTYWMNRL